MFISRLKNVFTRCIALLVNFNRIGFGTERTHGYYIHMLFDQVLTIPVENKLKIPHYKPYRQLPNG